LSKNGDKSVTFGRFLVIFESFISETKMCGKSQSHHEVFCREVLKRNKDSIAATFCSQEWSEQYRTPDSRAPEWKIHGSAVLSALPALGKAISGRTVPETASMVKLSTLRDVFSEI